jgi:hypothetical protein
MASCVGTICNRQSILTQFNVNLDLHFCEKAFGFGLERIGFMRITAVLRQRPEWWDIKRPLQRTGLRPSPEYSLAADLYLTLGDDNPRDQWQLRAHSAPTREARRFEHRPNF